MNEIKARGCYDEQADTKIKQAIEKDHQKRTEQREK